MIKKKERKHDQTVLLVNSKLKSMEVLISKALIDSNISHGKVFLINNMLKAYNTIKEEINNLNKRLKQFIK